MADPAKAHDAISTAQLAATVELACRAPSLHNSQPWRWIFQNGTLHLFADHARVGRHTDATGREVILSCGAALDHLLVAAATAGWQVTVERYPNPHDHDHLASAVFHRAESAGEHAHILGEAISSRRTDRLAFAAPQPWAEVEQQLLTVHRGTVASLDVIDDDGRPALADARSTAVATHLTDTNCSGGQAIPVPRTAFRPARYPPPLRRRTSMSPVTSPATEVVTGDHKSTAITRTYLSCRPMTTAATTHCDAVRRFPACSSSAPRLVWRPAL